ncbi:quinolinate synthase NadA [Acidobacteriota bacterium]
MVERITELKKARNASIIVHNYQIGEVQDVGDFVGDSLELSQKAAELDSEVIVFCGVHFMAETAKILSPEKTVLIPDITAGCPMADMVTGDEMKKWKTAYPGLPAVCYVNTSAEVKAECDVCCTSSNAVQVVESVEGDEILFAPDKNLADFIARSSKKKIIPWDGYCYVHNHIHVRHIREKREQFPDAEVWVHPESRPEVIDIADKVLSTGKMVKEGRATRKKHIIVGTEAGMVYRLNKENPSTQFHPVKDNALCRNMKKITLPKVLSSLEEMKYKVEVPSDIAERARGAIEKMVRL